jgi:hypothetical protein
METKTHIFNIMNRSKEIGIGHIREANKFKKKSKIQKEMNVNSK